MGHDSEYRSDFDQDPGAPRAARRALLEWLPDLPVQVRENALVAITELVTNAVLYGRAPIVVRASATADLLVVEVCDDGEDRPRRRIPAEGGGVGLNLVHLLADRVEIASDRSCVRCEFAMAGDREATPSRDDYEIELFREPGSLRIVLRGDIDLSARPELARVFAALDPSRVERVVIDLREVTFFDTTGLGMAARLDRWGRDNNVNVVFIRGGPAVMRALQSSGIALRLTFWDPPSEPPGSD